MATPAVDNTAPVELVAPDIEPYRKGNTGVEYATTFASGEPGPHVLITGLVHGNEISGALALDLLFKRGVRPVRGALTLAFANVPAFRLWDPANPTVSRWVERDFNRLWSDAILDGADEGPDIERARALRPVVAAADLLLDLHTMQQPAAPLMLAGPLAKGRTFARDVGVPALVVSDKGHAAGPRMRDYGGFSDPANAKNALLVEAGQHWEKAAEGYAIETCVRFLRAAGVVAADFAPEVGRSMPPPQIFVEVTHPVTITSDGGFRFVLPLTGGETIAKAGTVLAYDGDTAIVTPYDDCFVVMPSKRLWKGLTAVRLGRRVAA